MPHSTRQHRVYRSRFSVPSTLSPSQREISDREVPAVRKRSQRVSPLLPLRLALFHLSLHLPEMSASSGERKSLQPEIPSERTVQLCARSCSEAQQVWVVMCCLWVSAVRDSSRGGGEGQGGCPGGRSLQQSALPPTLYVGPFSSLETL